MHRLFHSTHVKNMKLSMTRRQWHHHPTTFYSFPSRRHLWAEHGTNINTAPAGESPGKKSGTQTREGGRGDTPWWGNSMMRFVIQSSVLIIKLTAAVPQLSSPPRLPPLHNPFRRPWQHHSHMTRIRLLNHRNSLHLPSLPLSWGITLILPYRSVAHADNGFNWPVEKASRSDDSCSLHWDPGGELNFEFSAWLWVTGYWDNSRAHKWITTQSSCFKWADCNN